MSSSTTAAAAVATTDLNIVVTGFGPFAGHEQVNASWEAVRALPAEHRLPDGRLCRLDRQHVEVTYEAVDAAVTRIWSTQPDVSDLKKKFKRSSSIFIV